MASTQTRSLKSYSLQHSGRYWCQILTFNLKILNLKPLHAGSIFHFYNSITSAEGKEAIWNEWKAAGIYDAIHLEIGKLPAMDPYHHIKPLVNESNIPIATNLEAVCQLNQEWLDLFPTREGKDEDNDDDEDAWEHYHKKFKHNLETVVEPILLYCASKYKQTKRTGYQDCLWTPILSSYVINIRASSSLCQDTNMPKSNFAKKCCNSSKKEIRILSNTEWRAKLVDH